METPLKRASTVCRTQCLPLALAVRQSSLWARTPQLFVLVGAHCTYRLPWLCGRVPSGHELHVVADVEVPGQDTWLVLQTEVHHQRSIDAHLELEGMCAN